MYINEEYRNKRVTAEQVKAELVEMAASPYRKISKRKQALAAAPYGWKEKPGGHETGESIQTGTGELDRLAEDLTTINNAIVESCAANGGYCRNVVMCEVAKAPRNLDSGRHYFNVFFVGKEGGIEMLKILGDVNRAIMGLSKRDGIDTGFFSSGAIGMSRQLDATDIIFRILKAAGGVYAQF